MEITDKIKNILSRQNRNIIFYFDADGSLREDLERMQGTYFDVAILPIVDAAKVLQEDKKL